MTEFKKGDKGLIDGTYQDDAGWEGRMKVLGPRGEYLSVAYEHFHPHPGVPVADLVQLAKYVFTMVDRFDWPGCTNLGLSADETDKLYRILAALEAVKEPTLEEFKPEKYTDAQLLAISNGCYRMLIRRVKVANS